MQVYDIPVDVHVWYACIYVCWLLMVNLKCWVMVSKGSVQACRQKRRVGRYRSWHVYVS